MGARTNIGLLTHRATFLVRMVDLSKMSRHGPTIYLRGPRPTYRYCSLVVETSGTAYLCATVDDI
jgi:hypothetical protein